GYHNSMTLRERLQRRLRRFAIVQLCVTFLVATAAEWYKAQNRWNLACFASILWLPVGVLGLLAVCRCDRCGGILTSVMARGIRKNRDFVACPHCACGVDEEVDTS